MKILICHIVVSYHITLYHIISHYITLYHDVPWHMSFDISEIHITHITLYHGVSWHKSLGISESHIKAISKHITAYHSISQHIAAYHNISETPYQTRIAKSYHKPGITRTVIWPTLWYGIRKGRLLDTGRNMRHVISWNIRPNYTISRTHTASVSYMPYHIYHKLSEHISETYHSDITNVIRRDTTW